MPSPHEHFSDSRRESRDSKQILPDDFAEFLATNGIRALVATIEIKNFVSKSVEAILGRKPEKSF